MRLIAIEGIDGSGKTTFAKLLKKSLEEKNKSVFLTSEPTSGLLKKVPDISSKSNYDQMMLYCGDRLKHQQSFRDNSDKDFIICDRYYYSTYAYNCTTEEIKGMWSINTLKVMPTFVNIFIQIPVGIALERVGKRNQVDINYENFEKLTEVVERYDYLVKSLPGEFWVVNGLSDPEKNVSIISEILLQLEPQTQKT